MKRTKLRDRLLPDYTKGEELFNMISHIVGGGLGVIVLISCIIVSIIRKNTWSVVGSSIYGLSMIALYTMSSIYHGLRPGMAKKVMQVMDHCTIYYLIAGTYTPIVLSCIRAYSPAWGWGIFAAVWGCAILGTVFTAIDLKKYNILSMICYIGMGWCIVLAGEVALASVPLPALAWILAGGIAYTIGAVLYGLGSKHRYMHSVFHLFVLLGSLLQYVGIIGYVI